MEYDYIFFLAVILFSTKLLGLLTKKIKLPQVVGALCAGLILGPACFGIVKETDFFVSLSELGVIVLMFTAGLEADIKELKKTGKASFIIALLGVIVPLVGGYLLSWGFNVGQGENLPTSATLQHIFIGIILTATSVSITVETLKEMGKLSTRAGNAILGAAIIDDILGIIALTIITSLAGTGVNVGIVLLKIAGFFIFAIIAAIVFHFVFVRWRNRDNRDLRRHVVLSFVFCLLMSYAAEEFFGVADITGAFMAGLAISNSTGVKYVSNKFETLSYMLLSPVFFASIGLKMTKISMSGSMIVFTVALLVVAILAKIVGCGSGAKICRYSNKESLQIATGMISRGEVALIVATKGQTAGLMANEVFTPIVIMVVATTILTPIFLKFVFKNADSLPAESNEAPFADNIHERDAYERKMQILSLSDSDKKN